ncbi:MAG: cation transporter [Spirulina sp.]
MSQSILGKFEKRSFAIARWANLVMAIAGILAAWLSNADALLVDGLYSGVNFLSSLVAAKVGESVMRPRDKSHPFGYYADEAVYITFRSTILLGILLFSAFAAVSKIIAYLSGRQISQLVFGVIVIYSVAMVAICLGLAWTHHRNWLKTHKQSDILKTEFRAAIIDGALSAGVGIAFGVAPLLRNTPLSGILPIIDSIVTIVLAIAIIRQPISLFLDALAEIAGESAKPTVIAAIREAAIAVIDSTEYNLVDIAASKLGRFHIAIIYLNSSRSVSPREMDRLRLAIKAACTERIGLIEIETILTEIPRLVK